MKFNKILIVLVLSAFMFQGCNLEQDVAPVPTFDGEANMTIAELIALHTPGNEDSYDTIPAGTVICGVVTTSDEWGNNYKYINIEDETGGIQLKIDNKALYNKYRKGQRVYVKCDGLHIGDYRKLHQLGIWANGSMQAVPNAKTFLYFFNDGVPQPVEPKIVLTSIPKASEIPDNYYNRLVRLEGATFAQGGVATFSDANAATSRDIKMSDGTTIVLRTSNYADFASTKLPSGSGNITGILTRYNNTVQIVISSLDDLENFTQPQTWQTIFSVNYEDAFNSGWTQWGVGGDWHTMSNSSFNGFFINQSESQDKWLISPAISLSNVQSPVLEFSHRAPKGYIPDDMKCYYTIDYTGDVTTTQWTEIDLSAANELTTQNNVEFPISAEVQNGNLRIAFRHKAAKSSWYVSGIRIKALF